MRAKAFTLRAPNRAPEAEMQKHVAAMLRAYLPSDVWWTASLSGVPLSPATAARAKAAGMQRGAPDLSFIWPDGTSSYIELKAPGGTLTPEQATLSLTLGPRFAVCRSWPEVKTTLTPWLERYSLAWLTDAESVRREWPRRLA